MHMMTERCTANWRSTRMLWAFATLVLFSAYPAWSRGTPEETWQEATGEDVWLHEFDLSGAKPGMHNVIIRARDAAGNILLDGPYNIRIDPSVGLPVVRIIYPEKDSVLRGDVQVIGIAGGRIGVEKVEIKIDGSPYAAVAGTEYWSTALDTATLADGVHTVYARGVDSRGTTGTETATTFILDRAPPSVQISSHASGALLGGAVVMEGRVDDANGIAKLALSIDGGVTYQELGFRSAKGETEATFSFPVQSRKIKDGAAIYQIRAVDRTGAAAIHPVLFFVDNEAPRLEILSPEEGAKVAGTFRVIGTMRDAVGIQSLSYKLNKETRDIEMRPGDPFWTADVAIPSGMGRSVEIEITAVDKNGNTSFLRRSFLNDAEAAVPKISITYPGAEGLTAFPADGAIYGFVSGGAAAESIQVEGGRTYPAKPGFCIPSADIGPGRSELRIQPCNADGAKGAEFKVRVARPAVPANTAPPPPPEPSRISVAKPQAYSYFAGAFALSGIVQDAQDCRLEYRLGPAEPWRDITLAAGGTFSAQIPLDSQPDGPVHMELRTVTSAGESAPVYHPLNKHSGKPEVRITTPREEEVVNGSVSLAGEVLSAIPLAELSYSLDGKAYRSLDPVRTSTGAAFSVVVDFTALQRVKGKLSIRAVDAAGNEGSAAPRVNVDGAGDLPSVQLNLPQDREVIRGDFVLSGMAFDDDGVAAIYWHIGPGKFERVATEQSFRIEVPLGTVASGEQIIEVYAEDIYGLVGPKATTTIRVSTDSPTIVVREPDFKVFNRGTTVLKGTARDLNGIAQVSVSMDNGNTFQTAEGKEAWSLALNTAAYKDGVYSVLVVGVDALGIESRVSSLLSIDNTPPVISLSEPADGRISESRLRLSGQSSDNIRVESLSFELSSLSGAVSGPGAGAPKNLKINVEPNLVILETLDISALPSGRYNLRMVASDAAGNTSVLVRDLELVKEKGAYAVRLFNPLPGIEHSGPLVISGRVTGPKLPEKISVYSGVDVLGEADVDRFGYFHLSLDEKAAEGRTVLWAGFTTPAGEKVRSAEHAVYLNAYGPVLSVESHRTGDAVTGRPWLQGTAGIELAPEEAEAAGSKAKRIYEVSSVQVSLDNGRSFLPAEGGARWKFRLETAELPRGPLPILVRAKFSDGRAATERILLTVDTAAPQVTLAAPQEGSLHADSLLVYGTATDDYGLEKVEVNLRAGDKAGYGIPQFIQGLYLDTHVLSATYADVGLGVSFFDDNVKLQVQAGIAPPGRFTGSVFGAKLIANVLLLPFDYFLGPDWSFFSMALALGANFSYFTMDAGNDPLVMSAVFLQWDFARFRISQWKSFRSFALYLEPSLWFAASDVEAGAIFKIGLGLRIGIF